MASRRPAPVHLFVDDRGEVLPRWQEAFRSARCESLADAKQLLAAEGSSVVAVWVRVAADEAAQRRMQAVVQAAGSVPVLVLADRPDEEQALALFGMGARGYCNTHAAAVLMERAWSTVEAGGLWVGEALMLRLVRATARAGAPMSWPAGAEALTAKEQEVLADLVRGASSRAVAESLGLSDRTVRTRLQAILKKANVSDRFALTRSLVSGISTRAKPLVADQ
jgi:DNA-binding NarL/FixJ family response regulator